MHVRRDRRQSDLKWQEISFYGGALFANSESAERSRAIEGLMRFCPRESARYEDPEALCGSRHRQRHDLCSARLSKEIAAVDHLFYVLFTFFRSSLTSFLLARFEWSATNDRKRMCFTKTISSGRPKNEKVPLAAEIAQYSSTLHCLLSFVVYCFFSRAVGLLTALPHTAVPLKNMGHFSPSDADRHGSFGAPLPTFTSWRFPLFLWA